MFDTLGTIFGFERMLVWGDDFPMRFENFRSAGILNEISTEEYLPSLVAGHFLDPEYEPPRSWGGGNRITWITQVRHPRDQLISARRYMRKAEPRLSRQILAATLARIVDGYYDVVGVLDSTDRSMDLAWLVHVRMGLPYVLPTTRNASKTRNTPGDFSGNVVSSRYTPLGFKGYEMLEWWELAMERVVNTQSDIGAPPEVESGPLPAILQPPRAASVVACKWKEARGAEPGSIHLEATIPTNVLPSTSSRFIAMVQVNANDHRGMMIAAPTSATPLVNFRHLLKNLPVRRSTGVPAWARRDLFGLGSQTSVIPFPSVTWAGVAFSHVSGTDITVRLQAPTSTKLEVVSDCHVFPAY